MASAVYGFGRWIFAFGGIGAIAGLPHVFGLTGPTRVALAGRVYCAIVMVAAMQAVTRRGGAI